MSEANINSRLEAFCDGVFAIALTLLIIDIKLPSGIEITSTSDLWNAIAHILPSMFAFLLSFIIILITWVNHHNGLKLAHKSSPAFIYANGLLLLTVVFLPFPTSLVGEYILTDHAAPAVMLFNGVLAAQAVAWVLISKAAIRGNIPKNDKAALITRKNGTYGVYAFFLYSTLAIVAVWYPLAAAIITMATWMFWLIHGITMKEE
jgi:uncharacterized membrane protein